MNGDTLAAPLAPREAYRFWAATYDEENVVSCLDEEAARRLTPDVRGLALLDAGCGTGRRLAFAPGEAPGRAVGVDLVPAMLARGRRRLSRRCLLAAGDALRLPVSPFFDVVWCRLAAGHIASLGRLYAELSRVARRGGAILVTDFHPDAARAGHARRFRDDAGLERTVEHFVHEAVEHERAAASAGLRAEARLELAVGPAVKRFYEAAGALARYERDIGLPVLAAFHWRKS